MAENIFATKSKADLIQIVRVSGVLSLSKAQKMKKQELADFLTAQMNNEDSGSVEKHTEEKPAAKRRQKAVAKTAEPEQERPETRIEPKTQDLDSHKSPSIAASRNRSRTKQQQTSDKVRMKSAPPTAEADKAETTAQVSMPQTPQQPETVSSPEELAATTVEDVETTAEVSSKPEPQQNSETEMDAKTASTPEPAKAAVNRRPDTRNNKNSSNQRHKGSPHTPGRSGGFAATARKPRGQSAPNANFNENETTKAANLPEFDELAAKPRPSRRANQNLGNETREEEKASDERSERKEPEAKDKSKEPHTQAGEGVLELMPDGYGFLRCENYIQGPADIYVPAQIIRRFSLRAGDFVKGTVRSKRDQDRYQALSFVDEVNGLSPEKMHNRLHFDRLTPIYPTERYVLETDRKELATRIIDLFSPIGKGQRGMIVSPPKAGKTILLQKIANAISINDPQAKLIVLLIDERPEEVTDMQRHINGEVVYSTFDKTPENHVKITELVLERAKRLVELGQDVVILLDSMTRMARAYNLTITPTGRTLSGGLDPGALYHPKRFFGAARKIENGGSLTIVATSLVETGSRMDEVIFEEFKGTGNMEVVLDRKLSEKRIFPAIDINRSGTRREELLLTPKQLEAVWSVRKAFGQLDTSNVTELIINLLLKTKDNEHMIDSLNLSLRDKNVMDTMRQPHDNGSGGHSNGRVMSQSF